MWFFLEFNGFGGDAVDIDHVGALRESGHVDFVLLAVEGGTDNTEAVAVEDGEQVLLVAKAGEFYLGGVDYGVGAGYDALLGLGGCVGDDLFGADEVFIVGAFVYKE